MVLFDVSVSLSCTVCNRNQGGFFSLRRRRVAVHGEDGPVAQGAQLNVHDQEGNQEHVDGGQNDEERNEMETDAHEVRRFALVGCLKCICQRNDKCCVCLYSAKK